MNPNLVALLYLVSGVLFILALRGLSNPETSRQGNLHNELVSLLGLDAAFHLPTASALYAVAYRPVRQDDQERFDSWPLPLAVGQPLPTVPLSLEAELCLPLDLEAAYLDACQRRRLDEVPGTN